MQRLFTRDEQQKIMFKQEKEIRWKGCLKEDKNWIFWFVC